MKDRSIVRSLLCTAIISCNTHSGTINDLTIVVQRECNDLTMDVSVTGTVKVQVHIMHANFKFPHKLGPNTTMHITHGCILCFRFYSGWSRHRQVDCWSVKVRSTALLNLMQPVQLTVSKMWRVWLPAITHFVSISYKVLNTCGEFWKWPDSGNSVCGWLSSAWC